MSIDNNKPVHLFPPDAIVNINVSGGFYIRLTKLLGDMVIKLTPEKTLEIIGDLQKRAPENDDEFNLLTLITLINELEKAAREQNKFEVVIPSEYEKPDEDSN
jgi:hypothetical protein